MEEEVVSTNNWTYHRPDCHTIRYSYGLTRFKSWVGAVSEGMAPCGVCCPISGPIESKVIGDGNTYHWPDCRILENVERYLMKTFQSWDGAVTEGLKPCRDCNPIFISLEEEEVICGINTYHRLRCPLLKYVAPSHIDRFPSWEEAEAKYKKPCVLCRPSSLILKKESTPPIEVPTTETTSFEAPMNEPTPEIAVPTTEATSPIIAPIEEFAPPIAVPSKVPTPPMADPNQTVDVNQLAEWRRRVVRLVDKLEHTHQYPSGDSIAYRISRLKKDNVIPRHVEPSMRTVTEMRNIAEYESKTLSPIQSRAVRAAWEAIEEWAQCQRIEY